MRAELGQLFLILAALTAFIQFFFGWFGLRRNRQSWISSATAAACMHQAMIFGAFILLAISCAQNDFSIRYVAENSNTHLPLLYKISAVWSAHEGSFLLWTLLLALWTNAVFSERHQLSPQMRARMISILGALSTCSTIVLLLLFNPFLHLSPTPNEGNDLNPLLQDPRLLFHPPLLYTGYVGLAIPFAFAIAALCEGRLEKSWIAWLRTKTLLVWAFLTIGIILGSWWAYAELGWGGWWFWDPVENASFMPWLLCAALIHTIQITYVKQRFAHWTLLLSMAAFAMSVFGTFLVRSGVIMSVHSFVADPSKGIALIVFFALICVSGGTAFLTYGKRIALQKNALHNEPLVRETLILIMSLTMLCACAMVLLGTIYPLCVHVLSIGELSVGSPYFSTLFTLFMTPIVALLPLGSTVTWQHDRLGPRIWALRYWALLAILAALCGAIIAPRGSLKSAIGICGGFWVLGATLQAAWKQWRAQKHTSAMRRTGMYIAHSGVGIFVAGTLLLGGLGIQHEQVISTGQNVLLGPYTLHMQRPLSYKGPNYTAIRVTFQVFYHGHDTGAVRPETRKYTASGQITTEAGIQPGLFGDTYVVLGEPLGKETWAIRAYYKPFVRWIWTGAIMIAVGAFFSAFSNRRSARMYSKET